MCDHVNLTFRDGSHAHYSLMDCSKNKMGIMNCTLTDEAAAHLMASGQFKEITVHDDSPESKRRDCTWAEKDFPAFIEKHLGAGALSIRHHTPEAVGQRVR